MTTWERYTTAPAAWEAMLQACEYATTSIDLEQFIFVTDDIGQKFITVCATKAAQGVKVRFLWDGAGSFNIMGSQLVTDLKARGIEVAFFNRLVPWVLQMPRWRFFRNHRRMLIIDGRIAFTGSTSIWNDTVHWRETTIRISGDIVAQTIEAFEAVWARAHHRLLPPRGKNVVNRPTIDGWMYSTNAPIPRRQYLYNTFIDALRSATHSITLTTPYFVPDHRLNRILKLAARRGVKVRLLIPTNSDHPIVDRAARSYFHSLLKRGVEIYLYKGFVHAKTAVIDNTWASVGTLNLDAISLHDNFESSVISTDPHFVATIAQDFEDDIQQANRITLADWNRRSSLQRWLEWCTIPLRRFL
jgi:cardiolipin synthase